MNINQLRLHTPNYALRSEDNILAQNGITIEPLHNGGFLVRAPYLPGKVVMIPENNVQFALGDDEPRAKK